MSVPQTLGPDRVGEAVALMARAFHDEVHFRIIFPRRRLYCLTRVMGRCLADGLAQGRVDAVHTDRGHLAGVAVWLAPGAWPVNLRRRLRHLPDIARMTLAGGVPARRRMLRFGDLTDRAHLRAPHWFLYVLAVDPDLHGQGHGDALLQHGLADADRTGLPVFLHTQAPSSATWYSRHGFVLHGAVGQVDGYASWPMLRQPNQPKPAAGSAVWAIVLAGGGGARFGGAKQYAELGRRPLVSWSIAAAAEVADGVVAVVADPATRWPGSDVAGIRVVAGGADRAGSVAAGLAAVPADAGIIVVADAAHPLAEPALFRAVVDAVSAGADGAVPGLPLVEVLARVDEGGVRRGGLPRDGLVQVQTPQAFRAQVLRRAHADRPGGTEDSALVADAGGRIVVVPGQATNLHITTPDDLEVARRLVASSASAGPRARLPPGVTARCRSFAYPGPADRSGTARLGLRAPWTSGPAR